MCGRYTLATPDPSSLRSRFPIGEAVEVRQRFNIAPGDEVLAVTSDREGRPRGELLKWGLVPPWSSPRDARLKMINARLETVRERPAFRRAFERFRCLIIADGFYEWQTIAEPPPSSPRGSRPVKQAFHITRSDGRPFAFAGLWSIWRAEGAATAERSVPAELATATESEGSGRVSIRSCTIITTAANAALAPLHDRMPVILRPDHEEAWIDPSTPTGELEHLLQPLEPDLTALRPVGPAVNDARYDGPECLAPPIPTPTLF